MSSKYDKFLSYSPETNSPLEISKNKKAIASDFSHGSFSGADIQVYVHYHASSVDSKVLIKRKDIFTKELNSIYKDIEPILSGVDTVLDVYASNITRELQSLRERAQYLELNIEKIDKALNKSTSSVVMPLGTIHTFSYSTFREKSPTRTLGRVYPKTYVRGNRSIAGTMVFTVMNRHVFFDLLELNNGMFNTGTSDHDRFRITTAITDQLPPLDFSLTFNNEYGATSYMGLYGVEFVQEGSTFSVEDIYSENVIQYVARDIDLLRPIGQRNLDTDRENEWSETASSLTDTYEKLNVNKRRNPFI